METFLVIAAVILLPVAIWVANNYSKLQDNLKKADAIPHTGKKQYNSLYVYFDDDSRSVRFVNSSGIKTFSYDQIVQYEWRWSQKKSTDSAPIRLSVFTRSKDDPLLEYVIGWSISENSAASIGNSAVAGLNAYLA